MAALPYAQCIECGQLARPATGAEVYPKRPDLAHLRFFRCQCGAYCGTHKNSGRPLGSPAGQQTRRARRQAHLSFDPLWREKHMSRNEAYEWLAKAMHLEPMQCHIAMMDCDTALRAARVAGWKLQELRHEAREAAANENAASGEDAAEAKDAAEGKAR